jgi:outer membrane protein OmpA-like peptidoglycan-associated protein
MRHRLAWKQRFAVLAATVLAAGCAAKKAAPPATPVVAKRNVFALLPDSGSGNSRIVVTNQAGSQELNQPNQAVRVERADLAPSAPALLDPADVRRLFGSALDVLPAPEVRFTLYFDEGRDVLNAASEAQIPAILSAIRERHSTAIGVTGHTDTTGSRDSNDKLGRRRAEQVARALLAKGVAEADLFVASHGDADLLVKTPAGVAEQRNRRVEVIVR